MRTMRMLFIAPLAILGGLLFITVGGALVMLLWNWLIPDLAGWREITFWQALGVLALCRILFGRFGLSPSGRSRMRRRVEERVEERLKERWGSMSPEERERLRRGMHDRWGCGPPTGGGEEA